MKIISIIIYQNVKSITNIYYYKHHYSEWLQPITLFYMNVKIFFSDTVKSKSGKSHKRVARNIFPSQENEKTSDVSKLFFTRRRSGLRVADCSQTFTDFIIAEKTTLALLAFANESLGCLKKLFCLTCNCIEIDTM